MINKNKFYLRVEVTFNRFRTIQGHLGTFLPENVILGSHIVYHIVFLALIIVTSGVVIARHVPWVNVLCLTKAI